MTGPPYDLIDQSALDLTSEVGKENALGAIITDLNAILTLLNQGGSTVPLLGTTNSGGLLSAAQKLILTGHGNADSLHTHASGTGGGGIDPTAPVVLSAPDTNIASGRTLQGVAGEVILNDLGAGSQLTIGLAATGAAAGQYSKVTIDNKGRVISGGALTAADVPAHNHAATDITSGFFLSARYGALTIPLTAVTPGAVTDGWIPTASGGSLVMAAPPSGTGEVNTASNINTAGVGIFESKVGVNLGFRGIDANSGIIAASIAGNHTVLLTPDYGSGTNQIPRGDHVHDTRYYQKSEVDNLVKVVGVVTKTTSYAATSNDQYIRADSTAAEITITLPDTTTNLGRILRVKRINGFLNTVHVIPSGADKIDALYTDWELWDKNEFVVLVATVGNWEIIDASYSQAPIAVGPIGAALTSTVKPNKQYLIGSATVNGGVWTIQGMLIGQSVHLTLLVNGAFAIIFAVAGQGRALWPNRVLGGVGGAQPPTTLISGSQDEVYATYNGADTLFSFRGQGYL